MNKEMYAEGMSVDPGMSEDTTQAIKEVTGEGNDVEYEIQFDLFTGTSMKNSEKEIDWGKVFVAIPGFDEARVEVKKCFHQLITTPEDSREDLAKSIIEDLQTLHRNIGIDDVDYAGLREGITNYEIALAMCANLEVVLATLISCAREHKLLDDIDVLTSGMNTLFGDGTIDPSEIQNFTNGLNANEKDIAEGSDHAED